MLAKAVTNALRSLMREDVTASEQRSETSQIFPKEAFLMACEFINVYLFNIYLLIMVTVIQFSK